MTKKASLTYRKHFTIVFLLISFLSFLSGCQNEQPSVNSNVPSDIGSEKLTNELRFVNALLVIPKNPQPEKGFRILATGGNKLRKAQITVVGPDGNVKSGKSKTTEEYPFWRIDEFKGAPEGKYKVTLTENKKTLAALEFTISAQEPVTKKAIVWKSLSGWDAGMEEIYSAWISCLFKSYKEDASWTALHEVTQDQEHNFLYNYLSLDEDNPGGINKVIMQPDCADNPFFLRAYFAWKLGLPFGYHICDRGYVGRNPKPGQWITNESSTSKTNPVDAFNNFLRKLRDGVQSGTARTALSDENSDYYPVSLNAESIRPGTVFADPYGHTLIITGLTPQTKGHPGLLLAVDAQPDGTVGVKRYWKGNFLFNTSGVIGEPGFKAFRPISFSKGLPHLMQNKELTSESGFIQFSLQQKKMKSDVFYYTMERMINPKPLDAETELLSLIQALNEQLRVRITSVGNGENYFKQHPGVIIPMPTNAAAIFQSGGQWEDFSTPNRDLRLLIAIDAITDFPDMVVRSPENYKTSGSVPSDQIKKKLQSLLDRKTADLSISYSRSDGSAQKLTIAEILKRKDAFEMGYNPNDGIEIRWGAPENSDERSTCNRHAPASQLEKMRAARSWFSKRLHPPT